MLVLQEKILFFHKNQYTDGSAAKKEECKDPRGVMNLKYARYILFRIKLWPPPLLTNACKEAAEVTSSIKNGS